MYTKKILLLPYLSDLQGGTKIYSYSHEGVDAVRLRWRLVESECTNVLLALQGWK